MRKLATGCAILAAIALVRAESPAVHVNAQEKPASPKAKAHTPTPVSGADASHNVDPGKEADIRQLMELTGAKSLGDQLMKAGMGQFRASVTEAQPDNPRAKQFVEAFVTRFQKHFDPNVLNDKVVPIYDKYLTDEDVKGLLQYYSSPLGQRMLKALPEVAREAQVTGVALGQKAAQETLEDLKGEYPEFVSAMKAEEKVPDKQH